MSNASARQRLSSLVSLAVLSTLVTQQISKVRGDYHKRFLHARSDDLPETPMAS
jgi:hypothetical protein